MMKLDTIMKEKMIKNTNVAVVEESVEKLPAELLEIIAGGSGPLDPGQYCPLCGAPLATGREREMMYGYWECWAECTNADCFYTYLWYE